MGKEGYGKLRGKIGEGGVRKEEEWGRKGTGMFGGKMRDAGS